MVNYKTLNLVRWLSDGGKIYIVTTSNYTNERYNQMIQDINHELEKYTSMGREFDKVDMTQQCGYNKDKPI